VIPVRDRADVIGRAVASVLAQTFAGLEVVVVDDGSTDGSVAAARAVSDGRVRVVRHDPHGIDTARAVGVRRAHGRWVALLDPDDEAAPGWLARMGRLVDVTGAVLVSCGGEQRHADGSVTRVLPSHVGAMERGVLACFRPGAFVVRRDLLQSVLDDDEVGGAGLADAGLAQLGTELVERLVAAGRPIAATPEPFIRWNEPGADDDAEHDEGDRLALQCAMQSLDALARSPIPDPGHLVRSATAGAIAAVRLGEHREARRLFALARNLAPDQPRLWARWAVGCVPPLATRVWAVPEPEGSDDVAEVDPVGSTSRGEVAEAAL
jgi:hypothetical protein